MMEDKDCIVSSTEILKDRLYFVTFKDFTTPKPTKNSRYFNIEDDIVYENFYQDFGPYHLCHLYQFCVRLNEELRKHPKKRIVFYSSNDENLRLNAAYLIGCYQIIYHSKTAEWVHHQLTENTDWNLLSFRDASGGPALFDISLLDVFRGLKIAHDANFFNFDDFDADMYFYYERVENGDLNWILPQKMLAFSGPHAKSWLDRGYMVHSPEHYHSYFRQNNVTTIVRLNKKSYDARQFTDHGFDHKDLFFVDGSVPSEAIVNRFINIAESAKGAVAVHCKAGLGRTGTLIACYMMKHHAFRAREAIAWLRICRPGSVIGRQQWFLETIETKMLNEGISYRAKHNIKTLPYYKFGIYSILYNSEDTINGNCCQHHCDQKYDNENEINSNTQKDSENNLTIVVSKVTNTAVPMMSKTILTQKKHYMLTTNSVSEKQKPSIKNFTNKVSTFPPRNASTPKITGKVQRTSRVTRRTAQSPQRPEEPTVTTVTLSMLTENCHLNGRQRLTEKLTNVRKKSLTRSSSVTKKKLSKNVKNDSFDNKRDVCVEDMDCVNSNVDETLDSQGNRLYKIKALRKKCSLLNIKKGSGVQTRSSSVSAVKKK